MPKDIWKSPDCWTELVFKYILNLSLITRPLWCVFQCSSYSVEEILGCVLQRFSCITLKNTRRPRNKATWSYTINWQGKRLLPCQGGQRSHITGTHPSKVTHDIHRAHEQSTGSECHAQLKSIKPALTHTCTVHRVNWKQQFMWDNYETFLQGHFLLLISLAQRSLSLGARPLTGERGSGTLRIAHLFCTVSKCGSVK